MKKIINVLVLECGMNTQYQLYRIRKSTYLRFSIGHTLQGQNIRLFTNFPSDDVFIRNQYQELSIDKPSASSSNNDSFDNHAELKASLSGSFQYYFTKDGSDNIDNKIGEGYFIVDPRFSFHSHDSSKEVTYELDGLVLQTYLAKNLGPFKEWPQRLAAAYRGHYNMVHFTPLQELGYSRSAYSIRDQLKVNPWFSNGSDGVTWEMIETFVKNMYEKNHCLSMTDLVFNHTSNDSPWIREHPECGYNVVNSPHLRPAYLMDRVAWNMTLDVSNNVYESRGLGKIIDRSEHLDLIRGFLWEEIVKVNFHEFFIANIDIEIESFRNHLSQGPKMKPGEIRLLHGRYERMKSYVDKEIAAYHLFQHNRNVDEACNDLRNILHRMNDDKRRIVQEHLDAAVKNFLANVSYRFIDEHGLKLGQVTVDQPLMWAYFYHPFDHVKEIKDCEVKMDGESQIMAFNGWVMTDDPMRNFAEEDSNVYLRRELIVWGDSVKLRYGKVPEDCPYLWNHMRKYTELTAKIFHAVRLDNCHGTPLHVAQYMLDKARAIRPDLYIVAELFTGSEEIDNVFVNRLGINSLIREALAAWNCNEQGRLIHKYGGIPVGSFVQQSPTPLYPSIAHALLYDMTHDNESPVHKRSPFDLLPSTAIVNMACCAVGSTRGYDEVVPHYIDVVKEERPYSTWNDGISMETGIMKARAVINALHQRLAADNFSEIYVDQIDADVISVARRNPNKLITIVTVAHSAFGYPGHEPKHRHIRCLDLPGKISRVIYEARTVRDVKLVDDFTKNEKFVNGLPGVTVEVRENIPVKNSQMINLTTDVITGYDVMHLKNLPPGSVIAVEIVLTPTDQDNIDKLKADMASQFNAKLRANSTGQNLVHELMFSSHLQKGTRNDSAATLPTLRELISDLSIYDLNRLLYRCGPEENADFHGCGPFEIPGFGSLLFCGIQGIMSELEPIRQHNDLGHPFCSNLRNGNWMMDYITQRLTRCGRNLRRLAEWFQRIFETVKKLPRFLIPAYFETVITCTYRIILEECYYRLGDEVVFGSSFVKALALNSIMLCSDVRNCKLPPLAIKCDGERATLSAGFPHFAEGIWRNWGRDTFISLRGLLLLTNRFEDARQIILTYGAVVRHGLIPNLLGDGIIARFNARDATWFWLNSIKEYELSQKKLGSSGVSILKIPVCRMYPTDDADGNHSINQPLYDVIQEILQRHAEGIKFIERNAGPKIDEHMKWEGFQMIIGLRHTSMFPFGGNIHNCGTWMDKMGSSSKAGNKGHPSTPRDGCPVEIVGLCASVLEWLISATADGSYPHKGVTFEGNFVTWNEWYKCIKDNFNNWYFIPLNTTDQKIAHNKGIYRDSVGSSQEFTDSQFRPNFLIAMTVAPFIFNPEDAWYALGLVEKELLGPLGMRTLCPCDWAYRGYYDNSNDSSDFTIAAGFNYHQGPEWVWLTGFYLRSKLIFCEKVYALDSNKYRNVVKDTISHVQNVLSRLHQHIMQSKWRSLPELTNKDGQHCHHSCEAQAWSVACVFEAVHDLIEKAS